MGPDGHDDRGRADGAPADIVFEEIMCAES